MVFFSSCSANSNIVWISNSERACALNWIWCCVNKNKAEHVVESGVCRGAKVFESANQWVKDLSFVQFIMSPRTYRICDGIMYGIDTTTKWANITTSTEQKNKLFVGNKLIECTSTPIDNPSSYTLSRRLRCVFVHFLLIMGLWLPSAHNRWNHLIHKMFWAKKSRGDFCTDHMVKSSVERNKERSKADQNERKRDNRAQKR